MGVCEGLLFGGDDGGGGGGWVQISEWFVPVAAHTQIFDSPPH